MVSPAHSYGTLSKVGFSNSFRQIDASLLYSSCHILIFLHNLNRTLTDLPSAINDLYLLNMRPHSETLRFSIPIATSLRHITCHSPRPEVRNLQQ